MPLPFVLGALIASGAAHEASRPAAPYVVVLGTAQDGGLPQVGCRERSCVRARRDPSRRRLVASLLIADPRTGKRWLIDATPDLHEQVERARPHPASRQDEGPRPPLFDGVFITHAHVGHYAGLVHFGREAYGAREMPLFGTDRLCHFLETNGPWDHLVSERRVTLRRITPGEPVTLCDDLQVTALLVPHRDEYSDTVGFVVAGPHRRLLYIPDIDKWERWDRRIEEVIAGVDVALIDGTCFADGEVAGRSMAEFPHPFVAETLERFANLPREERAKVLFTHLNHTNPAAAPASPAARRIRSAGCAVAAEGQVIGL